MGSPDDGSIVPLQDIRLLEEGRKRDKRYRLIAMVTLLTNESPTSSSEAGDARVVSSNVVMPTYKAMPKWKAYVMVSGRGLSLSGFKDGSRGGVVDSSMKAKTVLEDSLKDKFHERS
jgi:hypothetical protein